MGITLNQNTDCCETTCTTTTTGAAGPTGATGATGSAGATGAAGAAGISAFTETTSGNSVTKPGSSATAVLNVEESGAFSVGQLVFITGFGYHEVTAVATGQMTVKNLGYAVNSTSGITGGSATGATIGGSVKISPAGIIGTTGASGSGTSGLDTAGQLVTYDSSQTILDVGSNNHALFVNTGLGKKLNWRQPAFTDLTGTLNLSTQTAASPQLELAKLGNAGGAAGDIAYWNGSAWVRLAKGSNNQYLVFDTANVKPKWSSIDQDGIITARGSMQYNSSGGLLNILAGFNIAGTSVASNGGSGKLFTINFTNDLPSSTPTVVIGARSLYTTDIFVSSITATTGSRGIIFENGNTSDAAWDFVVYSS
jgi:hypothetical protein